MRETRREFVIGLGGAAGCFGVSGSFLLAQRPINPPPPPAPAETQPTDAGAPNAAANAASRRALLLKNEREFRAGVEELYRLTSELREELQKITTSDVFSVRIYKETEAIEKLAKRLKNQVKG